MTYSQVVETLYNSLAVFQVSGGSAYKPGIERIEALDARLGSAHRSYMTIHVAGTNGKGSVSHSLTSVLMAAGYKVGLYTSPHLKDFRERIRINGQMISEAEIVEFVEQNIDFIREIGASFFEVTASMAFDAFARHKVDVAVIEVGLGGRLDATNIITPKLSVITNIGFDHTQFLGSTLESIAREKAGIIKPGVPVVIGQAEGEVARLFEQTARERGCDIYFADREYEGIGSELGANSRDVVLKRTEDKTLLNLTLDLLGEYQLHNVKSVVTAGDQLRKVGFVIDNSALLKGLSSVVSQTGLQGRWQVLSTAPLVVCDTAHNAHGLVEVVRQIALQPFKRLYMVVGMVADKDVDAALSLLPQEGYYIFTRAAIERAMPAEELMSRAAKYGLGGETINSVPEALSRARELAMSDDMIDLHSVEIVILC